MRFNRVIPPHLTVGALNLKILDGFLRRFLVGGVGSQVEVGLNR